VKPIVRTTARKSHILRAVDLGVSRFDDEAWQLTRRLSPRPVVRVAVDADGAGGIINAYRSELDLGAAVPSTPWAMYLAGPDGRYRYLCFDLDASKGNAANDSDRLAFWLTDLNIDHLVTASGPTGGRHVWIALDGSADADVVADVARRAAQLLPSLDITPLVNPATGCVRPPGAPHRTAGFYSTVTAGAITSLEYPVANTDDLEVLARFLADSGASGEPRRTSPAKGVAYDENGYPHMLGARRPLSARVAALLDAEPEADTSVTLARVLAGLARSRWRFHEVMELLPTSPALEHARTMAGRPARTPVPHGTARRRLANAWSRAVYFVAANPIDSVGADDDFVERAAAAASAVELCQRRAQSTPGFWGFDNLSRAARGHRGRRVNRLVLDAICLYLVQAARDVIEVDTRRLAQDTGYGRESCRLALLALAEADDPADVESAWIVRVDAATGVHGGRFRLSARFSTEEVIQERAQVATRPFAQPSDLENRTWWIQELGDRLAALSQDLFAAPHSLGRTAGRVFASIGDAIDVSAAEIFVRAQVDAGTGRRAINELAVHGLIGRSENGWQARQSVDLELIAESIGVAGYLEERAVRYSIERAVWAWWQAEHLWMNARGKRRRRRFGGTGLALFSSSGRTEYPLYPRGPDRRADHRKAKQLAQAGALRAPDIWAAA
jgi:hypothetical protein